MKKLYEEPKADMLIFAAKDIITSSDEIVDDNETPDVISPF